MSALALLLRSFFASQNFKTIISVSIVILVFLGGILVSYQYTDVINTSRQFYYLTLLIVVLVCLLAYRVYIEKDKFLPLSANVSFIVLAMMLYLAIRGQGFRAISHLALVLVPAFYFVGKYIGAFLFQDAKSTKNGRKYIESIVLVFLLIHSLIGFLQLTGTVPNFNSDFSMSGLWGNPGPYAIYLSVLFPIVLPVLFTKENKGAKRILALIAITLSLAVIIQSQSRSAWIALAAGVMVLYVPKLKALPQKMKIWNNRAIRLSLSLSFALFIIVSGILLFKLKPESAIGRTFVWRQCLELISERPILGHGMDSFQYAYNENKVHFFQMKSHQEKYEHYSDNVDFAFNDYLQFWVEYGVLYLLLFALLIYALYKQMRARYDACVRPYQAALLVILVSSLFSYSLQISAISVLFYFLLGVSFSRDRELDFSRYIKSPLDKVKLNAPVLIIALSMLLFFNLQNKKNYMQWKEAYLELYSANELDALLSYGNLYHKLSDDKFFVYNYGSELLNRDKAAEAVKMLEQASLTINDVDVHIKLGNTYEKLGDQASAIKAFEKASAMVPYVFYPRYRLISLYYAAGYQEKALVLAYRLLNESPKVQNEEVKVMKRDIKEFVNWIEEQDHDLH